MKAVVNQEGCIACGLCVSTCPEVFAFNEEGVAEANGQLTDENFASAESARSACPVEVIDIVDE
ncbi:MAG: ferredoxin [Lachnospiraceae bacterium]|nr:ferredoxin [Lachnospiraceae bacterium]